MSFVLTDVGGEHFVKNGLMESFDFGLYYDDTDSVSETDDIGDISTEPGGSNYGRTSTTVTSSEVSDIGGDWGFEVNETFDTTDSSQTVDGTFGIVNFEAEDTSDSSATDHLHHTAGSFSQDRDLSQIDTLDVTITVTVS